VAQLTEATVKVDGKTSKRTVAVAIRGGMRMKILIVTRGEHLSQGRFSRLRDLSAKMEGSIQIFTTIVSAM